MTIARFRVPAPSPARHRTAWLGLFALLLAGCAGYQVGVDTLFPSDISTVYVPMFESNSFRRGLGERLTEAVMKRIEATTPFKVVGSPAADSVLYGRLTSEQKTNIVENINDEGREVQIDFLVEVTWVDHRGNYLRDPSTIPLPDAVVLQQSAEFIPEVGQSVATAQQRAIDDLAAQIVSLMEAPW